MITLFEVAKVSLRTPVGEALGFALGTVFAVK